jgi:predicted ArsR family transcriptional regulator
MWSVFNENPTREKIILLLKKRGPLSIDNLSAELDITSMGIRQHLLYLERKGLINYVTKRQGIGRPAFLYKLTEKADYLFPKTYDDFALNLLKDVETQDGRDKMGEIFNRYKNRLLRDAREALVDRRTPQDRVTGLKDFLEARGYFPELQISDDHYGLKIFNCPIFRIAADFGEACRHHTLMFRELLGKDVSLDGCIADGKPSCTLIIPKKY